MVVENTESTKRFLILYGTATGQAKAISEEIAEKATTFGLNADVFELDDIGKKFNLEKERCLVIVTSTTGDGDPPPNAEKFMRRIKKRILAPDYLAHIHYALLGLGDSNYSNFNRCARDLDSRLEELSANKFYPPGFADDGVGLEVVADPWLEGLYPALQKFLGVTQQNPASITEKVSSKAQSKQNGSADGVDSVKQGVEKLTVSPDGDAPAKDSSAAKDSSGVNGEGKTSSSKLTNGASAICDSPDPKTQNKDSQKDSAALGNGSGSDSVKGNTNNTNASTAVKSNTASLAPAFSSSSTPSQNSDSTKPSTPSESSALSRATNKQRAQCSSMGGRVLPETPCEIVVPKPPALTASCPPLCNKDLTVPVLPPPFLDVEFSDKALELSALPYQNSYKLPSAATDILTVNVSEAEVLTAPDAVKKTILLRLSLEGSKITYKPGDSLSIISPNNSSEVDLLIQRLQLEEVADQAVTITVRPDTKKRRAAVPPHIHPEQSTLRHILTTCVSIRDPPSKALIRALVDHTKDGGQARRLQELCSKEGAQDYTQCLRLGQITLLDFLCAFPSCSPPVETLLEHLPRLQPRPYSACSCQEVTPNSLDIVFNLVEVKANLAESHHYHRRGVCTGWLDDITSSLQQGWKEAEPLQIPVFVRTNQHFQPPEDLSLPLIMIGPGTGVAPFIGFLEGRSRARKALGGSATTGYGETWLYYGCRNKDKDFLFREKLEAFEAEGTLTQLKVTFSRDKVDEGNNTTDESAPGSSQPRYVQDQMRRDAADLARLLTQGEALVYVCGDAKNMAADVNAVFEELLQTQSGMSKDDAHLFVMKKRIHKTYLEDVWA